MYLYLQAIPQLRSLKIFLNHKLWNKSRLTCLFKPNKLPCLRSLSVYIDHDSRLDLKMLLAVSRKMIRLEINSNGEQYFVCQIVNLDLTDLTRLKELAVCQNVFNMDQWSLIFPALEANPHFFSFFLIFFFKCSQLLVFLYNIVNSTI